MTDTGDSPTLYHALALVDWDARFAAARADAALVAETRAAAESLVENGYAVVRNVVERSLCEWSLAEFWRCTEAASGGRLRRPASPADLVGVEGDWWLPNTRGILEVGACAHLPSTLAVRMHPRVAAVFALLHGVDGGLVSSADRITYVHPPEWMERVPRARPLDGAPGHDGTSIARVDEAAWLHTDQRFSKAGLHCVQGLVPCVDADQPGDATLEVVRGSHLLHATLRERLGLEKDYKGCGHDWYKLSDAEKALLDKDGLFANLVRVPARAGDLVLWDSRALHQGGRVRASAAHPRAVARPRYVVYACMQPTFAPLPPVLAARKRKVYEEARATAHWPRSGTLFGPPRTYGRVLAPLDYAPHVVRPLDAPGTYPVVERLGGLVPWLARAAGAPMLDFAPASGVRVATELALPAALKRAAQQPGAEKRARA